MVFSSMAFLFAFFLLAFILYFAVNNRTYRNCVLLVFSLLFYAWGEPKFLGLMLLATLVAYVGGLFINTFDTANAPGAKKTVFIITTVLLVLNLFIFKYLGFSVENLSRLFGLSKLALNIVLPIGISFYTFQILSYVIDLYRNKVAVQKNFFYLLLYVSLFPQLIAGPIVRYEDVENEITERHETLCDVAAGLRRFIVGLSKKVILANCIAEIAEMIYAGDSAVYGSLMYWLAAVCYAFQIYYDFSGYSDMAIGLGRIFGFHFLENFDHPYIASSVTDFWRRWHISLSSWFRDYIYIPLGGNRVSIPRHIFNMLVVWALTGLWHGASWNFIIWGLYYAFFLTLEKYVLKNILEKLPSVIKHVYTLLIVLVGWVIFDLTDFASMSFALSRMFSFVPTDFSALVGANADILTVLVFLPLCIIFMFPLPKKLKECENSSFGSLICNVGALILFLLCVIFIISRSYNPFIYFRF